MPDQREAQGGRRESGDSKQAVHLPRQEVWMAVEGHGEDRGRSARREMPHLRRYAPGAGLGVAHPVGRMGEGAMASAGAQVQDALEVGAPVQLRALDALPVAL